MGMIVIPIITPVSNFSRPDLWNWFSAAFPNAKYCLASATLTDAAVKDMQGVVISLVCQFTASYNNFQLHCASSERT